MQTLISKSARECKENARIKSCKALLLLNSAQNAQNASPLINMYRYQLDKSSKKFRCPNCHKKTYVRYIDYEKDEYLPIENGRCDREIKCGYFKKPNMRKEKPKIIPLKWQRNKRPNYHNYSLVEDSLKTTANNQFIQFLSGKFGSIAVQRIIKDYKLGNAKYWHNGTIFWQLDERLNVRGGKIIRYRSNGKRFGKPNWVHSCLKYQKKIKDFNLNQCLFGLHLSNENDNPIAIVESEKTACVMSEVYPKYLWMATGSLNGLNKKKLLPIRDRDIILYPDSGINPKGKTPFEQWELIYYELKLDGFQINISDLMEDKTTVEQKKEGYDLADFFLSKPN